jgi:para-aminobenzoate synthetase component 1
LLRPWTVRSQPLHNRSGADLFHGLYGNIPGTQPWQAIACLLESPYPLPPHTPQARLARYSILAGPPRTVTAGTHHQPLLWTPPVGAILPMLADLHGTPRPPAPLLDEQGQPWSGSLEPFSGGWLGWLGYDLAWEIERLPRENPDPLPFPVAFWYEPETFAIADHASQTLWLAATDPAELEGMAQVIAASPSVEPSTTPLSGGGLRLELTQADYEGAVRQAKAAIRAGDIFQANLSLRFSTRTQADSWGLYRRLQHINPSPFASYWRTPWGAVISCSPERLVSLQGDRAETRPIAGTRSRGHTPDQDRALAAELLANRKENAEHVMLVDLERNDLGRVCTWGTVQVDELMVLEPYSHVMHLVSNVVGQLDPHASPVDLVRAMFPGGTITGCPKVRCMEIIEALEPVRRSLFYGSCGYLDWRGHLDLNILIRTLLWVPDAAGAAATVYGQVGAGIVADSDPQREWQESLQKALAQLLALGLKSQDAADPAA